MIIRTAGMLEIFKILCNFSGQIYRAKGERVHNSHLRSSVFPEYSMKVYARNWSWRIWHIFLLMSILCYISSLITTPILSIAGMMDNPWILDSLKMKSCPWFKENSRTNWASFQGQKCFLQMTKIKSAKYFRRITQRLEQLERLQILHHC